MKKLLLAMAAVAMSMGTAVAGDHEANIVVVTHGSDTDAFILMKKMASLHLSFKKLKRN